MFDKHEIVIRIVVHEKGGKTQRVVFEGDQFNVGREEDNDLVLDRANVSKYHLCLRRSSGGVEVRDLDSTNGTYVNGRRLDESVGVRRSDRIYVGDYILMLDGDDPAIAPLERAELPTRGPDGKSRTAAVTLPPPTPRTAEEPLPGAAENDGAVVTSAKRFAPAGLESAYLDKIVDRVIKAAIINVRDLDPVETTEISDAARTKTLDLIDSLINDMRGAGELEESVSVESLKAQISRELLELGPLTELMKDDEVREIQVVGGGPLRVVRDQGSNISKTEIVETRFSGDRSVTLCAQRLARTWGFFVEGAQILEGKVADGFYMYALLPPTAARTPVLSLRRTRTDANTLQALVQEGVLSNDMRELLRASVQGYRRIVVCASGGVNLDRFMSAVMGEIPDGIRVACISDTGRLGSNRRGWISMRRLSDPRDGVSLTNSVGLILRGGLDMLVSQRCRSEDAAAVIDALSGAAAGTVVSLWGIDSAHALSRLAAMSTVASGAIQALTVALARSVDLLVRLGVGVNGEAMQVVEVVEPRVREGNEILHMPLFRAVKGTDGTNFRPTGTQPQFLRDLNELGLSVPMKIFKPGA